MHNPGSRHAGRPEEAIWQQACWKAPKGRHAFALLSRELVWQLQECPEEAILHALYDREI